MNDGVIKKIGDERRSSAATSCSRTSTATATRTRTSAIGLALLPGAEERRRPATPIASRERDERQRASDPKPAAARVRRPPGRRLSDDEGRAPTASATRRLPRAQAVGVPVKERLFAHPDLPGRACRPAASSSCSTPRRARAASYETYQQLLLAALRPRPAQGHACAACAKGSHVIGGTILGRIGRTDARARRRTSTSRSARPAAARRRSTRSRSSTAGSCSRRRPSTAPRAATCSTARTADALSIGQILLLPKPLLEQPRALRRRASTSTRAAATTSAPARSTAACSPRSSTWPSPASRPTRHLRSSAATAS